ncbi:MAG TPA: hypothetical protein DEB39_02045, partial [Planctomycetaceae bacterium]|nr:hypothetical protein [Planctomycetaceae bacterium]
RGGDDAEIASSATDAAASARLINVAWTADEMEGGIWHTRDKFGREKKRFVFGKSDAKPVVGDFNGDGIADIGIYVDGNWYIDINGNGVWDAEDIWCELGSASDQPLVGDWDGDGKTDIGIFGPQWSGDERAIKRDPGLPGDLNTLSMERPKNVPPSEIDAPAGTRTVRHSSRGDVRYDVIDHVFQYGGEGDVAVSGDFNGDGITEIGVYRNGNWYIDYNGDGRWNEGDIEVRGEVIEGAVPVVGDWNGDGIDRIGLFVNGKWHLDTTGDHAHDTVVEFGRAGDIPTVGDWSGSGIVELGVYRPYHGEPLLTQDTGAEAGAFEGETAQPSPQVALRFGVDVEERVQDGATLQGTLPEHLMNRPERTITTPYTSLPLEDRL